MRTTVCAAAAAMRAVAAISVATCCNFHDGLLSSHYVMCTVQRTELYMYVTPNVIASLSPVATH